MGVDYGKSGQMLIAVGLVYSVSMALTSAADREMTKEYLTCPDKAGGVTSEMIVA